MTYEQNNIKVPYIDLPSQHKPLKDDLLKAVEKVLDHGIFILGPEVAEFEEQFAAYCGARYAVGVDNGTSALCLSLQALGIGKGDEVITVPNPFLASASSIALVGATPVFVDVRLDLNMDPEKLEVAITPRTRAIIPVHLTGRPADMDPILEIARRHNVHVIEDAAQAVGARYNGQHAGTFGTLGCFSLHPMKTLNAAGDGGVVVTDDENLYHYLRKARNHGFADRDHCEFWSHNCRLDALQAAMLKVKIKSVDAWIEGRRRNAQYYHDHLQDVLVVPQDRPQEYAAYHAYFVLAKERDNLQAYLKEKDIEALVHHRIPIHLQPAAHYLGYGEGDFPMAERQSREELSLPVYPELTTQQKEHVVNSIRAFYQK